MQPIEANFTISISTPASSYFFLGCRGGHPRRVWERRSACGRITHIHLNGPNRPWGEGDTPIVEVLQLIRKEKYPMQAMIEYEYPVPEASDVLKEIAKCVEFCKRAQT